MENKNGSQNTVQGAGLDDVMKMFNDYEKKSEETPNKLKEDFLVKYFIPRNGVENFRILPPLDGRDIIEKAFFHYVEVNKASNKSPKGYKKIYCPKHNSPKVPKLDDSGNPILTEQGNPVLIPKRCPLCEKHEALLKKQNNSIKYIKKEDLTPEQKVISERNKEIWREANKWEAKKYYLVRGIDKGKPKDGIKFWRFKENFKNQGVYDKLVPALQLFFKQNKGIKPYDIENGTDLYINVVDSRLPNGNTYKDVSSITAMNPSKLHEDPIVVNQWISDTTNWRDVFKEASMTKVLNSEEYLERVAMGTDPFWDDRDEDNKRFIFPNPADAELMKKANERTESLDSEIKVDEMASDILLGSVINDSYNVNISNVTSEDVGVDIDNSVDVASEFKPKKPEVTKPVEIKESVNESMNVDDNFDDLPF